MPRHLFAKIFFGLLVLIIVIFGTAYFYAKPILLSIANSQLQKIFKEGSISGLKITTNFIELQDIKIREANLYDLKIKEARIYYNLRSIFRKKIDKIEALNLSLDLNKDDIKIKAVASLQLDIPTRMVDYVKLNVSLSVGTGQCPVPTNLFQIEGITLNAVQGQDTGGLYIKAINYNRLRIGDIVGKSELKDNILYVRPLLVSFLGGSVTGEFNISLDQNLNYSLKLNSQGLEINNLINDMKLTERFDMTGRIEGEFSVSGSGLDIKDIKGDFHAGKGGGRLTINDKALLENIARQSNQSLDKLVESFRNYNYNSGILSLYMSSENLVLDVRLDGETGKRNLTVVLHEFKK